MFGQTSDDPFLMLVTLSHDSFGELYLVNNTSSIISNGVTYTAFPMKITLPADNGETMKNASISFDNVSLELINEFRTVTDPISARIDMVLASNPDNVEYTLNELKINDITYNAQTVNARLYLDDFLNTSMTSEKYGPTNFPGLF